ARDLLNLVHHLLRPLERRAIRQLHRRQQITLILDRDEAGRHARQPVTADAYQDQRDDDGDIAVRDQAADQPRIAALQAVIDGIEAAIEPVALLRRYRPTQPQRTLRRLQRRGVDGRQQRRGGDDQRKLRIHAPRETRQEGRRQEHRDQDQRDADDRPEQRI